MTTLEEALCWNGRDITVSLFVVTKAGAPTLSFEDVDFGGEGPLEVRHYLLEDEMGFLPGLKVDEHDFIWATMPAGMEDVVHRILTSCLSVGAVVAWCGFEGSFRFDTILHPAIAPSIYGLAVGETVRVEAESAARHGEAWARLLGTVRTKVLGLPDAPKEADPG